jgi:SAM-dependent methyltransferase
MANIDQPTLDHFGAEWSRFDQRVLPAHELARLFEAYFRPFPWRQIPPEAEGFDVGCGSGRWAAFVASRVGRLHCIDASGRALEVARANLTGAKNCVFHQACCDDLPLRPGTMDFGYCLGVLHHVPDPLSALRQCVSKLKPGAPFLIYIYYALENRPLWYRGLWRATAAFRRVVCVLPPAVRHGLCDCLAATLYFPLARLALAGERFGIDVANFPLATYRHHSFYVMRNDALDRFGTPLEKRMSAAQIEALMLAAGLTDIHFSPDPPYWCAVGRCKT